MSHCRIAPSHQHEISGSRNPPNPTLTRHDGRTLLRLSTRISLVRRLEQAKEKPTGRPPTCAV